jgi:Plasmid pRiA4b ORF-3-like protein
LRGPWGYEHLLEVLADRSEEEHQEMLQWVGDGFDAEAFDLAETNATLELVDRHTRQRRTRPR